MKKKSMASFTDGDSRICFFAASRLGTHSTVAGGGGNHFTLHHKAAKGGTITHVYYMKENRPVISLNHIEHKNSGCWSECEEREKPWHLSLKSVVPTPRRLSFIELRVFSLCYKYTIFLEHISMVCVASFESCNAKVWFLESTRRGKRR